MCLFFCSCTTSSIIDYENKERQQFINNFIPIEQFEDYSVNGSFIFAVLNNHWYVDSYFVVFNIFQNSDEIPAFKISNILIIDDSGNTVFFDSGINLAETNISKGDSTYREKYNVYGVVLNQKIPLADITDEKYYILFEINGKQIKETLVMHKRKYVNMI